MTKNHQGGCHCKKVRYEAELDLASPVIECNCSYCAAHGLLLAFLPESQVKVTQGEDNLTEYRFNKSTIAHLFCATCGVQPFARAEKDGIWTRAINVRTIDDVELDELTRTKMSGKDF